VKALRERASPKASHRPRGDPGLGGAYALPRSDSRERCGLCALHQAAAQLGLQVPPQHCYVDEGFCGTRLDRPAFDAMRDAAADGLLDVVLVFAPDRLARNDVHQQVVLEELAARGVRVHFVERPIGEKAEDKLLVQRQGVIAEYERAKIIERIVNPAFHRHRCLQPADGRRADTSAQGCSAAQGRQEQPPAAPARAVADDAHCAPGRRGHASGGEAASSRMPPTRLLVVPGAADAAVVAGGAPRGQGRKAPHSAGGVAMTMP